ncbi:unnamed protein product [Thlaspi arvense]|uniref:TF-B3 domain-containing protein n=1 Tax=Thlaspi arvense TaxID=13288 RepID=A0AAU9T4L9_THLAR|nr:unnamed protein product [Thlaspi arvense]
MKNSLVQLQQWQTQFFILRDTHISSSLFFPTSTPTSYSIPLKFFSEHIEGRYEKNTVELESDACESTWKVKLEGRRLTVGWKEFTVAHDFRIGDIIIFRHEGDLVFHVTSFGPSCCEIQYVKESIGNLSTKKNVKTEPESRSSDQPCFVARVTDSNLREDTMFLPRKFGWLLDGLNKGNNKISLANEGERIWTLILKFRESSRTFYMRGGWRSFCHENGLEPGDIITFKIGSNSKIMPLLRFSTLELMKVSTKHSSKGKTGEAGESSQRVPSSSSSSSLKESRFVTLTATPASFRKSRIYLPMRFIRRNRMESAGGKKTTLLDKHGGEWAVALWMLDRRMYLGSGLKKFLKAIGVEANESFVLELVWEDKASPPMFKFCSKIKTRLYEYGLF